MEENQYIQAIKKLDELEDENILYLIANHFRAKADCIKVCNNLLKKIEND